MSDKKPSSGAWCPAEGHKEGSIGSSNDKSGLLTPRSVQSREVLFRVPEAESWRIEVRVVDQPPTLWNWGSRSSPSKVRTIKPEPNPWANLHEQPPMIVPLKRLEVPTSKRQTSKRIEKPKYGSLREKSPLGVPYSDPSSSLPVDGVPSEAEAKPDADGKSNGPEYLAALSRTAAHAAFKQGEKSIVVVDFANGAMTRTAAPVSKPLASPIAALTFSGDGSQVIAGTREGELAIWDTAGRFVTQTVPFESNGDSARAVLNELVPDGSDGLVPVLPRLLSSHDGSRILMRPFSLWWDKGSIRRLTRMKAQTYRAVLSPDGRSIASADASERKFEEQGPYGSSSQNVTYDTKSVTIRLLANSDDAEINLRGGFQHLPNIQFHPDGTILATREDFCEIKLWSTADGSLLRSLPYSNQGRSEFVFSEDGRYIAMPDSDRQSGRFLMLWRTSDGSPLSIVRLDETKPLTRYNKLNNYCLRGARNSIGRSSFGGCLYVDF